jgi:MoxR-like ATPase
MKLVGRTTEKTAIEKMVQAGKHLLLEGPVGVGKTTLAVTVASSLGRGVIRIDGDGRFSEQKLVGSFDPKLVLERGFSRESFLPGPLFESMTEGRILLINELNRMPEMVQNVLLPALDEGLIQIPYLGEVRAKEGFLLIATQNPREFVATSPLSEALLDRLEWIAIEPMTFDEEVQIVRDQAPGAAADVVETAVALVRFTRNHPKIRRGASIRAAISLAQVCPSPSSDDEFWSVAKSTLANRIELLVGKFSQQPFPKLLDELLAELRVQVETELKKKSVT